MLAYQEYNQDMIKVIIPAPKTFVRRIMFKKLGKTFKSIWDPLKALMERIHRFMM